MGIFAGARKQQSCYRHSNAVYDFAHDLQRMDQGCYHGIGHRVRASGDAAMRVAVRTRCWVLLNLPLVQRSSMSPRLTMTVPGMGGTSIQTPSFRICSPGVPSVTASRQTKALSAHVVHQLTTLASRPWGVAGLVSQRRLTAYGGTEASAEAKHAPSSVNTP